MNQLSASTTTRPGFLVAGRAVTCPHASIFHDFMANLYQMQNEQMKLVKDNRAYYDYFYDHLAGLPEATRISIDPEACAIVERIEHGAVELAAARDKVSTNFYAAAVSKMGEIAQNMRGSKQEVGEMFLQALSKFRTWRKVELDQRDEDMTPMLDQRKDYGPKAYGLFEHVFRAWVNNALPGFGVMNARQVVLGHIAKIAPEMAPEYMANMNKPEVKVFGRRVVQAVDYEMDIAS